MQLHREGRVEDADRVYRDVIAAEPDNADARYLSGLVALGAGQLDRAVELFSGAAALAPKNPAFHSNLGEALRRQRRFAPAMDALLKAMTLAPNLAAPTYNLGLLLEEHGAAEGALTCFERAAELQTGLPDIGARIERLRARIAHAQSAGDPGTPKGDPASALMLAGLAESLALQGRREQALALARRATDVDPRSASALTALATILLQMDRIDESVASFERALSIEPEQPATLHNLGNALARSGQVEAAVDMLRRARALQTGDPVLHGSLLFNLHFDPRCDAAALLEDAREWDRLHAAPLAPARAGDVRAASPERRLRVGYVSPDFRSHCQMLFMMPVLTHHDRAQVEVCCYSGVSVPDDTTERMRALADRWVDVTDLGDAALAERIRADKIDVLVDLTMHMERNRLLAFARRPAPVQVSWLAYPGTTGLSAIDYRITDPHLDPEGAALPYAERSLRLPDTFWCYDPCASGPEVGPLPGQRGHVRFGCLNNLVKVNDGVLALWARVLDEVEGSTMTALAPSGPSSTAGRRIVDRLAARGIDPSRIEIVGRRPRGEYLALYQSIDVCLDTFPYNGHTTSLDALWMGVPVVTLVGSTVVGRAGLSQAMNLGMPDLVARLPDEYVAIAAGLARDLPRLKALRAGLRARMAASPLMDGPRFARSLEAAYRTAWRNQRERAPTL